MPIICKLSPDASECVRIVLLSRLCAFNQRKLSEQIFAQQPEREINIWPEPTSVISKGATEAGERQWILQWAVGDLNKKAHEFGWFLFLISGTMQQKCDGKRSFYAKKCTEGHQQEHIWCYNHLSSCLEKSWTEKVILGGKFWCSEIVESLIGSRVQRLLTAWQKLRSCVK